MPGDPKATASASSRAMEMVVAVHGTLTQRERDIAQTAARAAYRCAMREMAEILQEKVRNA